MKVSDYENYHEIKEHYNNTFSYNTYPCCIPYDFQSVPLHWHNEMELIYIKKGTALITIDMNNYILDAVLQLFFRVVFMGFFPMENQTIRVLILSLILNTKILFLISECYIQNSLI